MVANKKPRIVIIGAGMAGLTAANKLYTCSLSKDLFEICLVEGGDRIGGRINSSEFGGDRIEMGATWIHGITGSPVHKIAQEIGSLESKQPWECMDGFLEDPKTVAEGGFEINPVMVESISTHFNNLMSFAQGKVFDDGDIGDSSSADLDCAKHFKVSVGSFLKKGLESYWASEKDEEEIKCHGGWTKKSIQEAIYAIHENTQRTYTSADDLFTLDFKAESEYILFPGEEISIAKGYISVIQHLSSVLPPGFVQLSRKVTKIEWQPQTHTQSSETAATHGCPVKLSFSDGSIMLADHVIVTVSLGVLKSCIGQDSGMFDPPLPHLKIDAISRLGYGVVNKLFVEMSQREDNKENAEFPFLQMAFHRPDLGLRNKNIPSWIRRTAFVRPIYKNSRVLLSWFAGKEALELESLSDEDIIHGVSTTVSCFLPKTHKEFSNGENGHHGNGGGEVKFTKMLKTKWGNDPLFLGSYSYVAVGSSSDDIDTLAEPLPKIDDDNCEISAASPFQILFAGEATHRTHYSTTHGAYFSGLREANRLLQHYKCV